MRLHGLREALGLSIDEMACIGQTDASTYEAMENGASEPSLSMLQRIAHHFQLPLESLLFGEEPRMNRYFLTRSGQGVSVERTKAYKYESLASGFKNRKANPFIVTIEPHPDEQPLPANRHDGQEFYYVIDGRLLLMLGQKKLLLGPGDSIYFDPTSPHAMKALDGRPVRVLAVILDA